MIKDTSRHYIYPHLMGKRFRKNQKYIIKLMVKKLYLKDIADIKFQLGDVANISHFNGNTNIAVGINKGENGDAN